MGQTWMNAILLMAGSAAGTYMAMELAKRYESVRFQKVIECTRKIETFMERRLKAKGHGLHAKINNVVYRLDKEEILTLRRIATMRNRLMHEADAKIRPDEFNKLCKNIRKLFKERHGTTF